MAESGDIQISPRLSLPAAVVQFRYARSSGPGGQNVNKLNTKATLTVRLDDLAACLPADAMSRFKRIAKAHLTEAGLQISSEESRSQRANRQACLERLATLVRSALVRPKKRKPTKPTRASKERRLKQKQTRGERKKMRGRVSES